MMASRIGRIVALYLVPGVVLSGRLPGTTYGKVECGPPIPSHSISEALGLAYPSVIKESPDEKSVNARNCGLPEWISIAGYADLGYRTTNFYERDYDTTLFLGDSRIEFWMPPGRRHFSWGPYVRVAGIDGDRSEAWENAWLAGPGFGFHAFPFSQEQLRRQTGWLGGILGPLRLFAEYNRLDYWGDENRWRPDEQGRAGADYWHALYVNDTTRPLWAEIWSGLFWQSANEFDPHYNSVVFANALRGGIRVPDAGVLSLFTPYALLESSLTDNDAYYWENRLLAGFGIRVAPWLRQKPGRFNWLTRFVVYAEYLEVVDYYRTEAPSSVPDHDFRVGISLAIGEWYR